MKKRWHTLALMCPTYGRAHDKLPAFLTSAYNMAKRDIRFVFCVNEKDTDTLEYLKKERPEDCRIDIVLEKTNCPNLAQYFNMMFDHASTSEPGTVVSMLGDDMVFETENYDQIILDRINKTEGRGIYWCDDGYIAHDALCVNLFVTRELVNATRQPFMAPFFKADEIDVVWMDVGRSTGLLQYIPEVVIKHNHNTAVDASQYDPTFQRLVPFQKAAKDNRLRLAGRAYSMLAAGNLINAGIGVWQ